MLTRLAFGVVLLTTAVTCRSRECEPGDALGCNAVILVDHNRAAFGRNLDVSFKDGWWVTHQRGQKRTSYVPRDVSEKPLRWESRHGSLTINAYHTDIPIGGMNEKGLVVEHLAIRSAYPGRDARPVVTPHQWIQYQLDMFSTVDEVVGSETELRITPWVFGFMHYLVCDADGNSAIIEYLPDGQGGCVRKVYAGVDIAPHFNALGNSPYRSHTEFMKRFTGFGGRLAVPTDRQALRKNTKRSFAWSAERLRQFYAGEHPDARPVDYVFETIARYRWDSTAISIVYEPVPRTVRFVTARNDRRRTISLADIDFSADAPRLALFWDDGTEARNWRKDLPQVNHQMLDYFCRCEGFGKTIERMRRIYRPELERYSYHASAQ